MILYYKGNVRVNDFVLFRNDFNNKREITKVIGLENDLIFDNVSNFLLRVPKNFVGL